MEQLRAFFHDLNTFDPHLQFTMDVGEHGLHFLDLLISIVNNRMETTVYSKPTDTHLYLNANSSHPKSQILGIAKGVALKLRPICSRDVDFWEKSRIYMKYPTDCGHDSAYVNRAFGVVGAMTREEARTSRRKVCRDSCVSVTKFNPRAPDIRKIFCKHCSVLDSDEQAKKILPEGAIFVLYKRNANSEEVISTI